MVLFNSRWPHFLRSREPAGDCWKTGSRAGGKSVYQPQSGLPQLSIGVDQAAFPAVFRARCNDGLAAALRAAEDRAARHLSRDRNHPHAGGDRGGAGHCGGAGRRQRRVTCPGCPRRCSWTRCGRAPEAAPPPALPGPRRFRCDTSRGLQRGRGPARRTIGDGGGVARPVLPLSSCPTWAAAVGAAPFRPARPVQKQGDPGKRSAGRRNLGTAAQQRRKEKSQVGVAGLAHLVDLAPRRRQRYVTVNTAGPSAPLRERTGRFSFARHDAPALSQATPRRSRSARPSARTGHGSGQPGKGSGLP